MNSMTALSIEICKQPCIVDKNGIKDWQFVFLLSHYIGSFVRIQCELENMLVMTDICQVVMEGSIEEHKVQVVHNMAMTSTVKDAAANLPWPNVAMIVALFGVCCQCFNQDKFAIRLLWQLCVWHAVVGQNVGIRKLAFVPQRIYRVTHRLTCHCAVLLPRGINDRAITHLQVCVEFRLSNADDLKSTCFPKFTWSDSV